MMKYCEENWNWNWCTLWFFLRKEKTQHYCSTEKNQMNSMMTTHAETEE